MSQNNVVLGRPAFLLTFHCFFYSFFTSSLVDQFHILSKEKNESLIIDENITQSKLISFLAKKFMIAHCIDKGTIDFDLCFISIFDR